jgi:hypothetical protein
MASKWWTLFLQWALIPAFMVFILHMVVQFNAQLFIQQGDDLLGLLSRTVVNAVGMVLAVMGSFLLGGKAASVAVSGAKRAGGGAARLGYEYGGGKSLFAKTGIPGAYEGWQQGRKERYEKKKAPAREAAYQYSRKTRAEKRQERAERAEVASFTPAGVAAADEHAMRVDAGGAGGTARWTPQKLRDHGGALNSTQRTRLLENPSVRTSYKTALLSNEQAVKNMSSDEQNYIDTLNTNTGTRATDDHNRELQRVLNETRAKIDKKKKGEK